MPGRRLGLAGRVHLASDMVHLLAAGAWLGGLPALAMLLAQARRAASRPGARSPPPRPSGFRCSGSSASARCWRAALVNSWNLLAGPRDLVATDYGRLVLLKIGLFVAMVGIAAVNRFHLTPRLPAPAAMRALQRNSLAETGLGLCVLLFVGALGTMAPTAHVHTRHRQRFRPMRPLSISMTTEAMADVTIDPGRAGRAKATIRVSREDFIRTSLQRK